jgi:hypothetical protein
LKRSELRDRTVGAPGEELSGVDDVHGAEAEALVYVLFLAERRGREHVDAIPTVGGFHQRVVRGDGAGVVRLAGLVDMRPFQLGLGRRESWREHGGASGQQHGHTGSVVAI